MQTLKFYMFTLGLLIILLACATQGDNTTFTKLAPLAPSKEYDPEKYNKEIAGAQVECRYNYLRGDALFVIKNNHKAKRQMEISEFFVASKKSIYNTEYRIQVIKDLEKYKDFISSRYFSIPSSAKIGIRIIYYKAGFERFDWWWNQESLFVVVGLRDEKGNIGYYKFYEKEYRE